MKHRGSTEDSAVLTCCGLTSVLGFLYEQQGGGGGGAALEAGAGVAPLLTPDGPPLLLSFIWVLHWV